MRHFLLLVFSCLSIYVFGQQPAGITIQLLESQHIASAATLKTGEQTVSSIPLEVPLQKVAPFLSYSLALDFDKAIISAELTAWIRFSKAGEVWTEWQQIEQDEHNTEQWSSQVQFTDKAHHFFQYQFRSVNELPSAKMNFYSPGKSKPLNLVASRSSCNAPAVALRDDWCPDGSCPEITNPSTHLVSHLIIHHSAGTNVANDWAAIVRAIWNGHVNTNGWSDIGYNWLVDPNGVLYEGRGLNVRGAHFCGRNTGTEGICVIGNFQTRTPTNEALNGLTEFLAWRTEELNLKPFGITFHNSSNTNLASISGHRDGCATACPGNMFYPMLEEVRNRTSIYREEVCELTTSTEQTLEEQHISVTPNPFNDHVQIILDFPATGTMELMLFNTNGQSIYNASLYKDANTITTRFPLNDLPSGIYFLTVISEESRTVKKVVKR